MSNDVILISAGYDRTIRSWEAWSGSCSRTIHHSDSVNRLAISPDKRFLAAAGYSSVKLYDINSNDPNPIQSFNGHTSNITAVVFQAEGKWIATGSEDGTVKIWDTRTSHVQRAFEHPSPVNDVVIHPNQGEIVSCDQAGSVKVWDLGENTCSHELVPEEDVPIRSVTIASDGSSLVAGNNKGNCFVWKIRADQEYDASEFTPITKLPAHSRYITKCILSPDTKHLATCSADTTIKIWSTHNYDFRLEKVLTGHQRWVWDAAFSADSAYLVSASSDHSARLWELASGDTVRQYNGHHKAATAIALNDVNLAL
ncbi:WD40 repeat-like protein [Wallemia mellicola CBS 633.66]|uniref:Protein LST8 homolog n=1 Tax=Wallemia mellicola (strain ATCC MYA-4683 / CBS 633.66) TaxID=671144 RepID=I4YCX6_WALMC|nr:WD40 repeat-like protein [Wallemia mellicola CBS 633.66]EIM21818.1 WD40 repeat-like protein [Wallemia mellicola CBS 633.66]|eukprot:XP_006958120.1 WD40 repeat-like protein [Wallemia mellicola CBS 633.66]